MPSQAEIIQKVREVGGFGTRECPAMLLGANVSEGVLTILARPKGGFVLEQNDDLHHENEWECVDLYADLAASEVLKEFCGVSKIRVLDDDVLDEVTADGDEKDLDDYLDDDF